MHVRTQYKHISESVPFFNVSGSWSSQPYCAPPCKQWVGSIFSLDISIWVCPLPPVPAILKINQNNDSSVDLWLHNFRRTHISTWFQPQKKLKNAIFQPFSRYVKPQKSHQLSPTWLQGAIRKRGDSGTNWPSSSSKAPAKPGKTMPMYQSLFSKVKRHEKKPPPFLRMDMGCGIWKLPKKSKKI